MPLFQLQKVWLNSFNVTFSSSTNSSRRTGTSSESRPASVEKPGAVHPWISAQLRNNPSSMSSAIPGSTSAQIQPSHPFIQDPAMPPNPAPNPLTQLEEAKRRLEEERRRAALQQAKQRCADILKHFFLLFLLFSVLNLCLFVLGISLERGSYVKTWLLLTTFAASPSRTEHPSKDESSLWASLRSCLPKRATTSQCGLFTTSVCLCLKIM